LVPAHRWTLLAVAALLVARRIHAILHPQFYAEDGCVFWLEQYLHGWRALGIPYAGYLHLAPRVIAGIASWFDPAAAPASFCAGAILVHLAVVAWLLSPRIELPAKPLLALATVLVPHTCEVFTNVTNVQWPLALALILLALARDATSAGQRWFDRATLVGVGLTGPFVLFLLPVFALRAWLRGGRESLVLLALCAVVAAVQAAVLVSSGLPVSGHAPDVRLLAAVLSCRLWGTMFAGYRLPVVTESTGMALAGAAASCAFVAACLRKGPFRHARVCFATSWLMLAAAVAVKFWASHSCWRRPARGIATSTCPTSWSCGGSSSRSRSRAPRRAPRRGRGVRAWRGSSRPRSRSRRSRRATARSSSAGGRRCLGGASWHRSAPATRSRFPRSPRASSSARRDVPRAVERRLARGRHAAGTGSDPRVDIITATLDRTGTTMTSGMSTPHANEHEVTADGATDTAIAPRPRATAGWHAGDRARVRRAALLAALALAAPAGAQAALGDETLRLFAWLDRLELPSPRGAPFVCVRFTGTNEQLLGFHVGDTPEAHEILTMRLELRRVAKANGRLMPYSLETYAKNLLGELTTKQGTGRRIAPSDLLSTAATARACWSSGMSRLAGEIWDAAGEAGFAPLSGRLPRRAETLETLVELELAMRWRDEIVATLRDPQHPLADALARCTRYEKALPEHASTPVVAALARGLRSAIARVAGSATASRPTEALLDRLVEQPDDLASPAGPAPAIERLGFDAVPGLLARLDDKLPTRAIDLDGAAEPRQLRVTTVGHHAFALLVRIAGGSLALRPGREPDRAAAAVDPASAARAWWAHAQPLGQLRYRVTATRDGDLRNARLLVGENPEAALEPLLDCLARDEKHPDRAELVLLLGRIRGARDWLALALAREGTALCRAAAAAALLELGDADADRALLDQWRDALGAAAFDPAAAAVLARALGAAPHPEARIALCRAPATLPAAFYGLVLLESLTRRPWPAQGEELAALRAVFTRSLDDWRSLDMRLVLDGVCCELPRVRDVAAQLLRRIDPVAKGYRFDAPASERSLRIRGILAGLKG
jgi:hypothetical protein